MLSAETRYGGFWRRLGALLLDVVIISPLTALTLWGTLRFRLFSLYTFLPMLMWFVFWEIYLVRRFGGTPGKRLLGLRIVKVDGETVGYREAILRCAPQLVLTQLTSIGMIMVTLGMTDADFHELTWMSWAERVENDAPPWVDTAGLLQSVWTWGEFLVLLTNRKRRALHDFIAGTVVIHE